MDLLIFRQLRLAPAVVQIHHSQRLDEQRGAAARLVMHQARDAPLELGAQRDNVAALALGDDRFLKIGRIGGRSHDALQALHQRAVRLAQCPPDPRQRVAGAVQQLTPLVNAARDLLDQVSGRRDASSYIGNVWKLVAKPRQKPVKRARPHQGAADIQQVHGQ